MPSLTIFPTTKIPVVARATHSKQKCKKGLALYVNFDWSLLQFRPHLDTLWITVPFERDYVTKALPILTEVLQTRVQVKDCGFNPLVSYILVQDVTPSVLSKLPFALKVADFGEAPFQIARLDIALDAFLRVFTSPEDDKALRLKAMDAIARHLSIDLSITDQMGGGLRWSKARRQRPTKCRVARKAISDGPSRTYRALDLGGTLYFGPKEGPQMYRIEHKTSDHRFREWANPLVNDLCRIRTEVELSGERLEELGLRTLDQITGSNLTSLRKLFVFGCPVLTDPDANPAARPRYNEMLGHFQAAGLWAVQDRRHWDARGNRKRPSVEGVRRWSHDATTREIALQPLNKQISKIFDRFGESFAAHKRHERASLFFLHAGPGLSKDGADFMAAA